MTITRRRAMLAANILVLFTLERKSLPFVGRLKVYLCLSGRRWPDLSSPNTEFLVYNDEAVNKGEEDQAVLHQNFQSVFFIQIELTLHSTIRCLRNRVNRPGKSLLKVTNQFFKSIAKWLNGGKDGE